jgi:hypothetical protein
MSNKSGSYKQTISPALPALLIGLWDADVMSLPVLLIIWQIVKCNKKKKIKKKRPQCHLRFKMPNTYFMLYIQILFNPLPLRFPTRHNLFLIFVL